MTPERYRVYNYTPNRKQYHMCLGKYGDWDINRIREIVQDKEWGDDDIWIQGDEGNVFLYINDDLFILSNDHTLYYRREDILLLEIELYVKYGLKDKLKGLAKHIHKHSLLKVIDPSNHGIVENILYNIEDIDIPKDVIIDYISLIDVFRDKIPDNVSKKIKEIYYDRLYGIPVCNDILGLVCEYI